jgi:hypothetical protein
MIFYFLFLLRHRPAAALTGETRDERGARWGRHFVKELPYFPVSYFRKSIFMKIPVLLNKTIEKAFESLAQSRVLVILSVLSPLTKHRSFIGTDFSLNILNQPQASKYFIPMCTRAAMLLAR